MSIKEDTAEVDKMGYHVQYKYETQGHMETAISFLSELSVPSFALRLHKSSHQVICAIIESFSFGVETKTDAGNSHPCSRFLQSFICVTTFLSFGQADLWDGHC